MRNGKKYCVKSKQHLTNLPGRMVAEMMRTRSHNGNN